LQAPTCNPRQRSPRPYWQPVANMTARALALVALVARVGRFVVVVEWFDDFISRVHHSLGLILAKDRWACVTPDSTCGREVSTFGGPAGLIQV
jgi:hypothetical protein